VIGQQTGQKLLAGAKTTGQKLRWARHVDEFDTRTARIVADGGETFRESVYRAADSDAIGFYKQLDRAVRKIDDLDGARKARAKQLVSESGGAGGAGFKLVTELDNDALEAFFRMEQKAGFSDHIDFRSGVQTSPGVRRISIRRGRTYTSRT
jgi:hypothetical protein